MRSPAVALALVFFTAYCCAQSGLVGFVEVSKGYVQLLPSDKPGRPAVKITGIAFLHPGDSLELGAMSTATLSQIYARRVQMQAGKRYGLQQLPQTSDQAVLSQADLIATYAAYGTAQNSAQRGTPQKVYSATDLIALGPRKGFILHPRPIFTWRAVPKTKLYRLILRPALDPDQTTWSVEVPSSSVPTMTFPDTLPALTPGEYSWTVSAVDSDGLSLSEDTTTFSIPTLSERQQIDQQLSHLKELGLSAESPTFQYVAGLLTARLYDKAQSAGQKALSLSPGDRDISLLLLQIYEAIDRADLREQLRAELKQ